MRKTLSVILSVLMLLSVCSFAIPASAAPEGTAINTADEFMAMAAEGKYYLNSDITLAASYPNPFVGTFDGNGHTLTVTNPVFLDFSGEVMNLTIKGDIVYQDQNAAGFTVASAKGFNATNCTNNVNVTVTGTGKWAAGFVCDVENNDEPCIFVNCVNNGDMYVDSVEGIEKMRVGGFGGIIDSVVFYGCTNNGDLYAKGNIPIVGGFVARTGLNKASRRTEAYNCVNNGNVKVEETYVGTSGSYSAGGADGAGFFGYIGGSGNVAWYKIYGCQNNGNIDAPYRVGGFVGYCYASNSNAFLDIQFSINTGNITYGRTNNNNGASSLYDYASPFIGYTNSPVTTVKYCIDTGTLTRREGTVSLNNFLIFVGLSSADATQYDFNHIYVLNKEQYTYFSWASDDKNEKNRLAIDFAEGIYVTTLEDIKSGKVAYDINTAAAADDPYMSNAIMQDDVTFNPGAEYYFYQKLGTEDYPVGRELPVAGNWILLDGTTYKNGDKAADVEQTTEKPEDTTAPEDDATEAPDDTAAPEDDATQAGGDATEAPADTTEPAKSGCGSVISGVVAIVAILGSALIIKKRD